MEPIVVLVIFVLFVSVAWFIATYNRFIKYKNGIEEAWSGIDVALKRRFNLIPNLIRTTEEYSEHEAKIFRTKSDYLSCINDKNPGPSMIPHCVGGPGFQCNNIDSRFFFSTLSWAPVTADKRFSDVRI
ncbi:MAG: LemA family protein [Ignavibacteriaceae bacterium]|jgi:hypothetical protein|nr:LemA family protein [Ignavibacteriaceae bacterium]